MTRIGMLVSATVVAAGISGCVTPHGPATGTLAVLDTRAQGPSADPGPPAARPGPVATGPGPGSSAATWQMPWQISPLAAGGGRRERIAEAFVPGTGKVRGTPAALRTIGRPLVAAQGANRALEPCRGKVADEARKLGAKEVEAVSAGPESYDGARFSGPVRVRITYGTRGRYEVRESTLICVASAGGGLVDAYVAPRGGVRS